MRLTVMVQWLAAERAVTRLRKLLADTLTVAYFELSVRRVVFGEPTTVVVCVHRIESDNQDTLPTSFMRSRHDENKVKKKQSQVDSLFKFANIAN
jgi:hypothetical protein